MYHAKTIKRILWRTFHVPPTLFLTQKTNDKCYAKCITKPSTSLSSSEEVRIHFWHEISFRLIFLSLALFLNFFLGFVSFRVVCGCGLFYRRYRLVFLAASTGTWKPVRNVLRAVLFYPQKKS